MKNRQRRGVPGRAGDEALVRVIATINGRTLADRARGLFEQQMAAWPGMRAGNAALANVATKSFAFDGISVRVEWNPGRLISTTAPEDLSGVSRRPCFLCATNLPPEQKGIRVAEEYLLLCNPYPIFRKHYTLASTVHVPQGIDGRFGTMLDIAREMTSEFVLLYNGPRCGASAPDHHHFQCGERGFLPIEGELSSSVSRGRKTASADGVQLSAVDDGLRRYMVLEGDDRDILVRVFSRLRLAMGSGEEPMMNILVWHDERGWHAPIFPRKRHRPSFFSLPAEKNILISPAATECGGVCITPRERDFERVTREHLLLMFSEVMVTNAELASITDHERRIL